MAIPGYYDDSRLPAGTWYTVDLINAPGRSARYFVPDEPVYIPGMPGDSEYYLYEYPTPAGPDDGAFAGKSYRVWSEPVDVANLATWSPGLTDEERETYRGMQEADDAGYFEQRMDYLRAQADHLREAYGIEPTGLQKTMLDYWDKNYGPQRYGWDEVNGKPTSEWWTPGQYTIDAEERSAELSVWSNPERGAAQDSPIPQQVDLPAADSLGSLDAASSRASSAVAKAAAPGSTVASAASEASAAATESTESTGLTASAASVAAGAPTVSAARAAIAGGGGVASIGASALPGARAVAEVSAREADVAVQRTGSVPREGRDAPVTTADPARTEPAGSAEIANTREPSPSSSATAYAIHRQFLTARLGAVRALIDTLA